ncbi:MAG: hypothetical protein RLZZ340_855 [Actinomycetota bacterium]
MLHHISVGVSNIVKSGEFYDAILEPLGYIRAFEVTIKERDSSDLAAGKGFHLAFAATSIEAVNQWHARGLQLGATDKGSPKFWDEFGPNYYAAYLIDPDGWQIEAVFKESK